MPVLNLESLKTAGKLDAVAVPVPEFGEGFVAYVGELSADERDSRLEIPWIAMKEASGQTDGVGFRALAVAACWCDAERNFVAIGKDAIIAVAKDLGSKDSVPVTRMFAMADTLNALSKDSVETIAKN